MNGREITLSCPPGTEWMDDVKQCLDTNVAPNANPSSSLDELSTVSEQGSARLMLGDEGLVDFLDDERPLHLSRRDLSSAINSPDGMIHETPMPRSREARQMQFLPDGPPQLAVSSPGPNAAIGNYQFVANQRLQRDPLSQPLIQDAQHSARMQNFLFPLGRPIAWF